VTYYNDENKCKLQLWEANLNDDRGTSISLPVKHVIRDDAKFSDCLIIIRLFNYYFLATYVGWCRMVG
jgi:hypothetical protein